VSQALLNLLMAVAILVGIAGIIVPVLPGVVLILGALIVWAVLTGGATAWVATSAAVAIIAVGQVLKYLLPHRKMSSAGVPGRSMVVGSVAAVVGFFAIPVVGVFVGFIAGVFVAEQFRLRNWGAAWTSTWVAMKATGFSMLIELASVLLATTAWIGALIAGV
jgi:uncharacterized protein